MTDAAPLPSPAPSTAKDAATRARPRRVIGRAGIWLSALLVLGLAIVGTAGYWRPLVEPLLPSHPQPDDQLAGVNARLAAIERRLDAIPSLDDRIAAIERSPAPDASAALAPVEDQLQRLSARLDAIEARLSQLIKDQATRGDSAQRVLIVALADLGNAISTSRPFAAQLASVAALGQSRPGWAAALRPLEGAAKSGIPSTAVLAQRFSDETAAAILRSAAASPSPDSGLGDAVLAKLRALVVIRRTDGSAAASSVDGAVGAAEAALGKGDLAGAVAALGGLTGAAADVASSWLQQAQQRLKAEETIATLTQELSSDLAAASGSQ